MAIETPPGLAADVGGTNIRLAYTDGIQLLAPSGDGLFDMTRTPGSASAAFDVLAGAAILAEEQGFEWLAAGFPCPVKYEGASQLVGNAGNPANPFHGRDYDLQAELRRRGVNPGFHTVGKNDLTSFTYAAAQRAAKPDVHAVLGIGLGTGVGTGYVYKDKTGKWSDTEFRFEYAASIEATSDRTYEDWLSGTAINRDSASAGDNFWDERGQILAHMVYAHAAIVGPDLVFVGGGAGGAFQEELREPLQKHLDTMPFGWGHQAHITRPRVEFVKPEESDYFALYGASAIAAAQFYTTPARAMNIRKPLRLS